MSTEVADTTNLSEKKDFLVRSSSLKDVRSFSREVFEKFKINEDLREELVLAIAEAAQNIVKHAYKDYPDTQDSMAVRISWTDKELEIMQIKINQNKYELKSKVSAWYPNLNLSGNGLPQYLDLSLIHI